MPDFDKRLTTLSTLALLGLAIWDRISPTRGVVEHRPPQPVDVDSIAVGMPAPQARLAVEVAEPDGPLVATASLGRPRGMIT